MVYYIYFPTELMHLKTWFIFQMEKHCFQRPLLGSCQFPRLPFLRKLACRLGMWGGGTWGLLLLGGSGRKDSPTGKSFFLLSPLHLKSTRESRGSPSRLPGSPRAKEHRPEGWELCGLVIGQKSLGNRNEGCLLRNPRVILRG